MNRRSKFAALAAVVAGLTAGSGCGVFDDYNDDYPDHSPTHYVQDQKQPPATANTPPRTSQSQIPPPPTGPMSPGIHNDADQK